MDINETLRRALKLATLLSEWADDDDSKGLANYLLALDRHMCEGGALPERWVRPVE